MEKNLRIIIIIIDEKNEKEKDLPSSADVNSDHFFGMMVHETAN